MTPPIIGLSGYARSGKDTVGAILVHHGYQRRAFADALKRVAVDIGWDGAKDDAGRRLLQDLGVACRTHLHPDVWVDAAMADLPARVVFTDVRFPNEAQAIVDAGGEVWRVERARCGPANDHVSETALDGWPFDRVINNHGTLLDLRREVAGVLDRLTARAGGTP